MSSLLNFLKVWFTSDLSQSTLVFTAWSILLIVEYWIIGRGWWQLERLILFYLEIKLLNWFKADQIIEIYDWLSIDFLHK